jgi:hypothetical protein
MSGANSGVGSGGLGPANICRTLAFRAGYEDAREGLPPCYEGWAAHQRLYELGRLIVAYMRGRGEDVPALPRSGRIDWRLHQLVTWRMRDYRVEVPSRPQRRPETTAFRALRRS